MAKIKNYLPSGAFKINGTFLEDSVPGYHTLNANNKWTLEKQISTVETATRSGAIFTGSRYPARQIDIEYYIEGEDWSDLQSKYTQLMRVLDVENAEIIFNGEPDKFVRGYFSVPDDIETTDITRSGTFTIVCPDPFKYSVTEYTANAVGGQFNITYDGTYKGYPTFVTQFANSEDADGDSTETSECGFVGFANQREEILQFGDPEETDWADVNYPATVPVNKDFKSTTGWTLNGSKVITGTQTGSMAIGTDQTSWTYPSGYGSGTNYHGPSLSKIITGETDPIGKNYNFNWGMLFGGVETVVKTQFGGFECLLWNNDNGTRQLMSGVRVMKTARNANCTVYLYVGSSTTSVGHYTVNCSKLGTNSMKKVGSSFTFNVGGVQRTFNKTSLQDTIANEITFHFMKKGSTTALSPFRLYRCKLQRTSFDNYENIANIFAPGDVLTVNTQDAGVYLDDGSATIPAAYLGALGNDWEDFYLNPGTNIIGTDYSDFTTDPPTFTIKYRERFI
jgi:predicted phage tail component-like protein